MLIVIILLLLVITLILMNLYMYKFPPLMFCCYPQQQTMVHQSALSEIFPTKSLTSRDKKRRHSIASIGLKDSIFLPGNYSTLELMFYDRN